MKYEIKTNTSTVTISKMMKGDRLYAEQNSMIACSPVVVNAESYVKDDTNPYQPALVRKAYMPNQTSPAPMNTKIGKAVEGFLFETKKSIQRQLMKEESYVLYEALEDGQKVTFGCPDEDKPGTVLAWNATPLEDGEVYTLHQSISTDVKSVTEKDVKLRPHGTLCVTQGRFIVADFNVKTGIYNTGNVDVKNFSETGDRFSVYSTDVNALDVKMAQEKMESENLSDSYFDREPDEHNVFIQVCGDLVVIPLYPGESVPVYPGFLLAFTDSCSIEMVSSGDPVLRNKENNDYLILLTANKKGGYVFTHTIKPKDSKE